MLALADLLFQVTFINSDHNHHRLQRFSNTSTFHTRTPKFLFKSIPDGLPPEHPRSGPLSGVDLFSSIRAAAKPQFHRMLTALRDENDLPTFIIADGIMSFVIDIAEELEIPVFTFRTYSACCTWIYFHLWKLIEEGVISFQATSEADDVVTCIPGVEGTFRRRDLPHICRCKEPDDPVLQFFISETTSMRRASALILNTFDGLESPFISMLGSLFPKIYTLGPLHGLLPTLINETSSSVSSNGILWGEDRSCMTWLDSQPSRSVIYVSFGSLVVLSVDQLMEFWHGLVNSGKPFLWVIRADSIVDQDGVVRVPQEVEVATRERGCVVSWAPQEEVLAHRAIGGFWTHSGWNSTLESMYAGVPMICWPGIADQQVNARCVSEVWRVGFDMKDTCDRSTVERMVRDLMEEGTRRWEEIMKSTSEIATMARDSVREGGSSYGNLEKLIEDIRCMHSAQKASNNLHNK